MEFYAHACCCCSCNMFFTIFMLLLTFAFFCFWFLRLAPTAFAKFAWQRTVTTCGNARDLPALLEPAGFQGPRSLHRQAAGVRKTLVARSSARSKPRLPTIKAALGAGSNLANVVKELSRKNCHPATPPSAVMMEFWRQHLVTAG